MSCSPPTASAIRSEAGEFDAPHARRAAGHLVGAVAASDRRSPVANGRNAPPARPRRTRSNAFAPALPELLGGSADLTGSNLTDWKDLRVAMRPVTSAGNHINYGVREFGMAAIMNGMALHGGYIPFGGTFLTFSDYAATRCAWPR